MKKPVIVREEAEADLTEAYHSGMSNKSVDWAATFSCAWVL